MFSNQVEFCTLNSIQEKEKQIKDLKEEVSKLKYEKEITYRVGQRFKFQRGDITSYEEDFILANFCNSTSTLISLETGCMWSKPVPVENIHAITEEEFVRIVRKNFLGNFKLIPE